jgi:hypothetical protein
MNIEGLLRKYKLSKIDNDFNRFTIAEMIVLGCMKDLDNLRIEIDGKTGHYCFYNI